MRQFAMDLFSSFQQRFVFHFKRCVFIHEPGFELFVRRGHERFWGGRPSELHKDPFPFLKTCSGLMQRLVHGDTMLDEFLMVFVCLVH